MLSSKETEMTDPMDSLNAMQSALNEGIIRLQSCELYPEIGILLDQPNGFYRYSYVQLNGQQVEAIALIVMTESIDTVPCFQIGYAVIESMRRKGLGKSIIKKALTDFKNGMQRNSIKEYYIEALISTKNKASNIIASRLLSNKPVKCKDEITNESAYQYLLKVI
jgi:hypothetical protein